MLHFSRRMSIFVVENIAILPMKGFANIIFADCAASCGARFVVAMDMRMCR